MSKNDSALSLNEERALTALLTETTISAAAEQAGLSERSLYRYLGDPSFKAALREQHDAILSSITSSLLALSTKALVTLEAVLDDPETTPASKVRASLGVLSHARSMVEMGELLERLVYLERTVVEVRR